MTTSCKIEKSRIHECRRHLADENRKHGPALSELPHEELLSNPAFWKNPLRAPQRVWRSREFLVQLFIEPNGSERLSILRAELNSDGQFKDGISWDDLQRLKREAGYGDRDATEVYPADKDVVNIQNMRHLFLAKEPLHYKWKAREQTQS